jgi:hypothetical protein
MLKPAWALETNANLGTYQERVTVSINLPVFNPEDLGDDADTLSPTEIYQFGTIDSSSVNRYADNFFFYVRSNGLAFTSWGGNPPGYPNNIPRPQNYVHKFPRNNITIYGSREDRAITNTPALGFIGLAIDGVPFKSPNSEIKASIGDKIYTENSVIFPEQFWFNDGSGIVGADRKFYYHSDPKLLYEKNSNQHSPIVGYAFDGNPIYGPFGYTNPTPSNMNNPGPVKVMRSSYRYTDVQRDNGTMPDGTYIEDFEYVAGYGDLDRHNGRFCKTPEYPEGIYAYFITVDPDDLNLPRYPYIIGPTFYNEPLIPNGKFVYPGDINIRIISGQLPPGLRIEGTKIVGTPYEVYREKTFRFVLRATNAFGVSDRTFTITVQGEDSPVWITPAGDLPVGNTGEKIETTTRILDLVALDGSVILKLNSIKRVRVGSVISSSLSNENITPDTKVASIDPISRTIRITKPLLGSIPPGASITFNYTVRQTEFFILDNEYLEYQLSATDADLPTGQELKYYIPPKGGELPPGVKLSDDGILSGFVEPILVPEGEEGNGNYDMHLYDKFAYDYGVRPSNGFDSFLFDNQLWDFSDPNNTPRKLNRYYEFVVRVTDGYSHSDRKFRIYVVGDDFFRADNTIMQVGTNAFTADSTYLRKPIWLTPPYLGKRRANNYITVFLQIFETVTLQGTIGYILDLVNDDGTPSILPPGMALDSLSGEIYGDVPYQPAVTKTYKFTVRAIRYDPQSTTYSVNRVLEEKIINKQTTIKLTSVNNIRVGSFVTSGTGNPAVPRGMYVTAINTLTRTVTVDKPFIGEIPAGNSLLFSFLESSSRTFTLDIMGEVDSVISFITPGDLGEIPANFISNLSVEAQTTVPNAVLHYKLAGGSLPPGLRLVNDGTIQGSANQFKTSTQNGLTTFDLSTKETTFDNAKTLYDREYVFIVVAEDQFKYSATSKIFKIRVSTPNNKLYSNMYVKPFITASKRLQLIEFFSNPEIFNYERIYRHSDLEFGVQTEMKMLVYAGIETKTAAEYTAVLGRSYKKRFRFSRVKKAIAKIPGTNTVVYEAVYVEILDNLENSQGSVKKSIVTKNLNSPVKVNQGRRDIIDGAIVDSTLSYADLTNMQKDTLPRILLQDRVMSADYSGQKVSDFNRSDVYGNSMTNIRTEIGTVGDTERNYLPLWMRTPQNNSGVDQGYIKAVVLCYCKPGEADRIILNIKNSGFDFKKIDFTIDRVIIDSTDGDPDDKYIAFGAREVING